MSEAPPLSSSRVILLTIALSLATFLFVLDYSIANVAIPYISGGLAVSTDQGIYVITSFAVGNAIMLPITGWLTKRVGSIRLITLAVLFFTFFSWTCGSAPSFMILVISRFLQGVASGPIIPLSQTLLLRIHRPENRSTAMAVWGTIVITAPIVGPVLGGWISYDYYWPWIFYINIPVGLFTALVIWFCLKEHESPREKIPTDFVGLILLALCVCSLQFMLDKGEQFDWWRSDLINLCAVTSIITFTLLIVWSLTTKDPLIDLRLFKIRTFALSVFYIGIMYSLYFGSVVLVPLWLQTSMNYTSIWAGIAVAPIGIIPFLLGPLMGKLTEKFGIAKLLACCFFFFSLSCFYTAYFDTAVDLWHIGFSRFLLGAGMVFFITPLFALSVQGIQENKMASATGVFHFVRGMMGGVGTSVFTTLWMRRSAFHHARIGESLTPYSPQTTGYLDAIQEQGLSHTQSLTMLNDTLTVQGQMMGINDCFFLMGWLFLALFLFLPLCRSTAPPVNAVPSVE